MNADVFRKVPYDLHGMNVQSGIRQPQQFIVLVPGVTGDSSNHTINGGQLNSSTLQVDGHNWQLINRPGIMNSWPPPFEAIESSSSTPAQYGAENPIGTAVTQFTFKSGPMISMEASRTSRGMTLSMHEGFSAGSRLRPRSTRAPSPWAGRSSRERPTSLVSLHATADGAKRTRLGGITVPTPLMKQGTFQTMCFPTAACARSSIRRPPWTTAEGDSPGSHSATT